MAWKRSLSQPWTGLMIWNWQVSRLGDIRREHRLTSYRAAGLPETEPQ